MMEIDSELVKARVMDALFEGVHPRPKVGRFTLIQRIAVGGMGEVYEAHDEQLGRKVAIKLLHPDLEVDTGAQVTATQVTAPQAAAAQAPAAQAPASVATHDLLREARTLAAMPHHPNLVQVYEVGLYGDRVFLAMEYLRGCTLRDWIAGLADGTARKRVRPPRWRRILKTVSDAGSGLAAAHGAGVVHRDFKPENVVVCADERVCVIDFGVARHAPLELDDQALSAPADADAGVTSSTVAGTPPYMSPEQLRGVRADARSDQFSFSIVLYEALYGVRPFEGNDLTSCRNQVLAARHAVPARDSSVPRWIWNILERGLSVDPAKRYDSMQALLAALSRDPAQRRRRYTAALVLLGTGALLASLALRTATETGPCELAGEPTESIWNANVATEVARAFHRSGVTYADETWQHVRPRLEAYAAELAGERRAVCLASVHHAQADDLVTLKRLCLASLERSLKALATEFLKANSNTARNAVESTTGLPHIETCRNDEVLTVTKHIPEDPQIQTQAASVRAQIAEARARQSLRQNDSRKLAEAALAAAKVIRSPLLLAEASYQAGAVWRLGSTAADLTRAEETLLEAADLAEDQRNDGLLVEIWLELLRLATVHHDDPDIGLQYARRALAASTRLNDDSWRMLVTAAKGALYYRSGDYAVAESLQREALQLADKSRASELSRADIWNTLAGIAKARGELKNAQAAYKEAIRLTVGELGDHHPRVADLSFNFALLCRQIGELPHARDLLHAAIEIWGRAQGAISMDVADADLELTVIEIESGNLDEASRYTRAAGKIFDAVAPNGAPLASVAIREGLIAFRKQQFDVALAAFERGLSIRRRTGASIPMIAVAISDVAEALVELGRPDEALIRLEQAERLAATAPGTTFDLEAALDKVRGLALLAKGSRQLAIPPLERALSRLENPGSSLELADVRWALARSLPPRGGSIDSRACSLAESARKRYQELGAAGRAPSGIIQHWQMNAHCARSL